MRIEKKFWYLPAIVVITVFGLTACSPDDESSWSDVEASGTTASKVTKPTFDSFLTTSDYDGFALRARFKTGGAKESDIHAKVHWKAFSTKPASKPSKSDLTIVESMRQYGTTYYNSGSKKGTTYKTVFEKEHAGYKGGTYIYYYVECTNSAGSAESSISYVVIKR